MANVESGTYTPVWAKYRPAILKLMLDASREEQEYKLYEHEFRALNEKKKGGFHFTLQMSKGKAINKIKDSMAAQDLLSVLQLSTKALELTNDNAYQIMLDKNFVLHVSKLNQENTN